MFTFLLPLPAYLETFLLDLWQHKFETFICWLPLPGIPLFHTQPPSHTLCPTLLPPHFTLLHTPHISYRDDLNLVTLLPTSTCTGPACIWTACFTFFLPARAMSPLLRWRSRHPNTTPRAAGHRGTPFPPLFTVSPAAAPPQLAQQLAKAAASRRAWRAGNAAAGGCGGGWQLSQRGGCAQLKNI